MEPRKVTSTEFQNRAGLYIEESGKSPVFITRYERPVRVLLDIEEYARLTENDKGDNDMEEKNRKRNIMNQIIEDHREALENLAQR